MSRLWRNFRRGGRLALDRTLAVVLLVAAQIELLAIGVERGPVWLNMLVVAGYSLPFAWRRRRPLAAAASTVACIVVLSVALTDATNYVLPFLSMMIAAYGAGAYADGWPTVAALVGVVGGVLMVSAFQPDPVVGDFVFPASFACVIWLAGRGVRTRTRLTEALHEETVREQEAREQEAQRAAAEERRRIAREMHDVVAHSVSVMVVQAGGARRILERDPDRAVAAAEQIECTGREAMAEMRRLLGVLHAEAEDPMRAPQPTMDGVGALVERARAAGLPVELHQDGERRPLPAGLDLAAYRVVQEGLTNAIKHSGGAPTEVHVRWGERDLELEIADRGPGPSREQVEAGGGHGLIGMRERVKLYGGELDAGRRRGGGFRIRAKLPLVSEDAQVGAVA
jgi:signal transduction histidine kinase